ncbi:hypothetical protein MSHRCOH1_00465 [Candidatus Ornithobacterium hominis]|nr:hypothetical protein MSHRCOH1_00465 [Candidatus Ornithobacterium hominis]
MKLIMILQYIFVGILILIALVYLFRKLLLPLLKPGKSSCEKGCGCTPKSTKKS